MNGMDGRNAHKKALVTAHSSARISGLASHPDNPFQFCSVADDHSVRIYDAKQHQLLRMSQMDTSGRCCGYSPDGQMVVIGLGSAELDGKVPEKKEGAFLVLSEEDLTIVFEMRDSKKAIVSCSFSPNQEFIALASLDGIVYLYHSRDCTPKAKCKGHSGGVTHMDFSTDSRFLMSNSQTGELLFWLVDTGELLPPRSVRDVSWETNSCVFSLDTQGFWTIGGTEHNMCCASHASDLIAAVDAFGRIKLMSFPALRNESNFNVLKGHGANIKNCCFSSDDSFLFTSGGSDGAIIQWRVSMPVTQSTAGNPKNDLIQAALASELNFEGTVLERNAAFFYAVNDHPIPTFKFEEDPLAAAPLSLWQRAIVAPSQLPPINDFSEPLDSLELSYVYGFSVDKSRQSLLYAVDGDAVFLSGSIVVKMNPTSRKQRYYLEHTATLTALAIHPLESSNIIASGQMGELAEIRIWNASSLQTLFVVAGYHKKAINHLQFSLDGSLLVTVGMDSLHSVAVYDWRNETIISCSNGFANKSLAISFFPDAKTLIHCGNEIIRFW